SVNAIAQEADTKYWIIFKDKGNYKPTDRITPGSEAYDVGKAILTERAIQRRLKVLSEENLIDYWDLPIEGRYVTNIEAMNIEIIAMSRWLNGVSAYLTQKQAVQIKKLDYVDHLPLVNEMLIQEVESTYDSYYESIKYLYTPQADSNKYDYGPSLKQTVAVNVPKLHTT